LSPKPQPRICHEDFSWRTPSLRQKQYNPQPQTTHPYERRYLYIFKKEQKAYVSNDEPRALVRAGRIHLYYLYLSGFSRRSSGTTLQISQAFLARAQKSCPRHYGALAYGSA